MRPELLSRPRFSDALVRQYLFPQALGGFMLSVDRPAFRFQDLGATPGVGTSSEPLGLVLDQRLGGVLGAERVSNGDFSASGTGWAVSTGGWTFDGTRANLTGNGTAQTLRQDAVFEVGKVDRVEYDVSATGGFIGFERSGGALVTSAATGRVSVVFAADLTWLAFKRVSGTVNGWIDNVTVREIPGTHFGQSTSTSRPVVVADGRNVATAQFDGGDDTLPALASVDYSAAQVMAVAASFALTNATEGVIFRSTASGTTAGTLTLIGNRGGVAGRIAAVYRGTGGTDRVLTLDAGATGTLITARAEADRTTGELRLNVNGVDAPPLAVADLGTFAAGVPSLSAAATPLAMKLYGLAGVAAASLSRGQAALLSRWAAWKMGV